MTLPMTWTLAAGVDLSDSTHIGKAIDITSGTPATTDTNAGGILLHGAPKGGHISIGYCGAMRFLAAAHIPKGSPITINQDGAFIPHFTGTKVLGQCLNADVAADSIGYGIFNFSSASTPNCTRFEVTSGSSLKATLASDSTAVIGKIIDLKTNEFSTDNNHLQGVILSTNHDYSKVKVGLAGIMRIQAGESISQGDWLKCNGSGLFVVATSGDDAWGRCLASSLSAGELGYALINFASFCTVPS